MAEAAEDASSISAPTALGELGPGSINAHLSHVGLANFQSWIDLDSGTSNPSVGDKIAIITPAHSRDGYSVCKLHEKVPNY
jgi:hypothetical protein